jgi:hypothetical protein
MALVELLQKSDDAPLDPCARAGPESGVNQSGSQVDQGAAFMTAPSGTTPWVTNRHTAIRSRRAIATTITLRLRRPGECFCARFGHAPDFWIGNADCRQIFGNGTG